MIRNILFYFYILIGSIVIGIILLISVDFIPQEKINNNIYESYSILEKEGLYPRYMIPLWQLDNFTDALMLNISFTQPDDYSHIDNILYSPYFGAEDTNNIEILKLISEHKTNSLFVSNYGRYWHGYKITLKPLLLLFNYNEIRIINSIIFIVLFTLSLIGVWIRLPKFYSFLYWLTILIFYFPLGPFSLQFSTCFLITVIAVVFLVFTKRNKLDLIIPYYFFIIGILVAFFDFLTTPLITLCIPLIIYGGLSEKFSLKNLFLFSLLWFIGYSLFWSSKWILASLLTNSEVFESAIESIKIRTDGEINNGLQDYLNQLGLKINFILFGLLFFFSLVTLYLYIKTKSKDTEIYVKENYYLCIIALYPFIWISVLRNHSTVHFWFVYRIFASSFFAISIFLIKFYSNKLKYRKLEIPTQFENR